jgi:F-type H+-transporting ATPase subunit a
MSRHIKADELFLSSPLDQFSIQSLKTFDLFGIDFSITNQVIFLLGVLLFYILSYILALVYPTLIPSRFQIISETIYLGILNILKQQAGILALKYYPFILTLFLFILGINVIGLLPFGYTASSHLVLTFSLAFTINLALVIIGFEKQGLSFLQNFVPKGSPKVLLPLLVVIETVSYLLRPFSLSIRLFANMMAGHTLLHILASFTTAFILSSYFFLAVFPFTICLAVVLLEICIAFLQAYVFIVLTCIYANDSLYPKSH